MALVMAIFNTEGLFLAGDGADLCFLRREGENPRPFMRQGGNHIFMVNDKVAVGLVGSVGIYGQPTERVLQRFFAERGVDDAGPDDISWMLLDFFASPPEGEGVSPVSCLVAGYEGEEPRLIKILPAHASREVVSANRGGITWIGEGATVARLLKTGALSGEDGEKASAMPPVVIPWALLSPEEAENLQIFLFRTSAEFATYQAGLLPIDELRDLVHITPEGCRKIIWRGERKDK